MKKLFIIPLILFSTLFSSPPPLEGETELLIENRILTEVRGKNISVLDVVKKMDLLFSRLYPEYNGNIVARYQFYKAYWRQTFSDLVDEQLILLDAEEVELKLTEGDVRSTIQERFGPNVISNLAGIGLSYEEAREIIRDEMLAERMIWYRVNMKAILDVHPKEIKAAYTTYCKEHPPEEKWDYRFITVRGSDKEKCEGVAAKLHALLEKENLSMENLPQVAKERGILEEEENLAITVSSELSTKNQDLAASYRTALAALNPHSFSSPLEQKSRTTNENVQRIFYLKDHTKEKTLAFSDLQEKLKLQIEQEKRNNEYMRYIKRMRKKFLHDDREIQLRVDTNFEPFTLE